MDVESFLCALAGPKAQALFLGTLIPFFHPFHALPWGHTRALVPMSAS